MHSKGKPATPQPQLEKQTHYKKNDLSNSDQDHTDTNE